MDTLTLIKQIQQRLEILYQEIDKIEGGGGVSPDDAYTKAQSDALFVRKETGKGLSSNDFTNSYKNQIDTNTTNITNLTNDVNSIFELDGFSATEGSTLPAAIAPILQKHRPFLMNGRTWYYLSGDSILDYFALDNSTIGYPEIHYARIQQDNRNLMVLESFNTDTTPIEDSQNFITSGGVFSALSAKLENAQVYRGTEITAGTDLNDLTTYGTYYCSGSSIAATLGHCPVTGSGFVLQVYSTGNRIEYLYPVSASNSKFYWRCRTSNTWQDWFVVEGTPVSPQPTAAANLTSLTNTLETE